MAVELGVEINQKQQARLLKAVRRAPKEVVNNLERAWNKDALDFRRLMQDKHLEGGTTASRLARRSSNLYNSLRHEIKLTREQVNVIIWFLDIVAAYAPTHEEGDASRNIPARMNLHKEWKKFEKRFIKSADEAIKRGLKSA